MNYRLCFYSKENDYRIIDFSKVLKIKKQSLDLMSIDGFTMIFKNEKYLIDYLISNGLMNETERYSKLMIQYGGENIRIIRPLYSSDKETYLKIRDFSIEIKKYFKDRKYEAKSLNNYGDIMGDYPYVESDFKKFRSMAKNIKFLQALQIHISPNPAQQENIKALNNYMTESSRNPRSKEISIVLFEIFRRIFYKYDSNGKKLVFRYKEFRDFVVFYNSFKENYNIKNNNSTVSKEIDGIDDYREPIFPPNSEELREYQKYLDNLPDEAHPHRYR